MAGVVDFHLARVGIVWSAAVGMCGSIQIKLTRKASDGVRIP